MKFYINNFSSLRILLILNFTKYGKAGLCSFEAGTCNWGNVQKVDDFDWSVGNCNRFTHKNTDNKDNCAYIESLGKHWEGQRAMLRLPLNRTTTVISFRSFVNTCAGDLNLFLKTSSFEQLYWSSNDPEKNKWVFQSLCIIGIRQPAWLIFEATRGLTQDYYQNKVAVDDIAVDQAYSNRNCFRADIRSTAPIIQTPIDNDICNAIQFMPRTTIGAAIRKATLFKRRTTIGSDFPKPTAVLKSTTNYTPIIVYTSMATAIFCISICSFAYVYRRCKNSPRSLTAQQRGQTLSNTDTIRNTIFVAQVQSDETHPEPDGPPPPYSEI